MQNVWLVQISDKIKNIGRIGLMWSRAGALFLAAAGAQAADDLAELRSIMDPVENIQGEFRQVITDRDGETIQQSRGRFGIKRPGFFYWQSEEPYPQTIIGTPDKLWIYDPDLEQATLRKQTLNDAASPVAILTGDPEALKNRFEVTHRRNDEAHEFVLIPKARGEANYREVAVVFRSDQLERIRFVDKLDQITQVDFDSIERNTAIDPKRFEFSPPPGTDIVRDDQ